MTNADLCRRWGRSGMFVTRLLNSDPDFPKPIKLGPNATAWWHWPVEAIQEYERLCAARSIPARTDKIEPARKGLAAKRAKPKRQRLRA
jgi:predicted DNA-binding transcriptional regulator AlpA